MSAINVPDIIAACSGVNAAGQVVDQLCRSLVNIDNQSDDYQNRKQEVFDCFNKIDIFQGQLKNLLG